MANQQKLSYVNDLVETLKQHPHFVLVNYDTISHTSLEQLRGELRKHDGTYFKVVKNSLLKVALLKLAQDTKQDVLHSLMALDSLLLGQTAIIAFSGEWTAPIKAFYTFAKDYDKVAFKVGLIENAVYEASKLEVIAQLPSKEQLYAKVLGSLMAPQSKFVFSLSYTMSSFVRVLKGIQETK
ncbi:MAG: 50S ribosomal protein L10 [Microgenomates bacterium OLB22]|nr:MAG: 50S ribosomal protein L10 [Microgenomates bacterium OLB22]